MFDFIKPEKHAFLKKVVGIGALFGALGETLKQGPRVGAGFFAFFSLFVFVWLVDTFKEAGSELVKIAEEIEVKAFSSKRILSVDLSSPPNDAAVESFRAQTSELLHQRFPTRCGAQIVRSDGGRYLFRAQVRRDSLCACEISAQLRTFTGILAPTRKLTPESNKYLATLEVIVQRRSGLRNFLTGTAIVLVAISSIMGLAGNDDGAQGLMSLTAVLLIISVPPCIWSWDKMARWFPASLLTALTTDVSEIMAENGLSESRSEARPNAEPRPPFWEITLPTPYWKKLAVGLLVLSGASALAVWYYYPTRPKLEDGVAAARAGNYQMAKEILMPFANKGNVQAREQLAQLEPNAEKLEDYDLLQYLAGLGCARAQYMTGQYMGDPKSVCLMKKASDQGYVYAQSKLADWYAWGDGVAANPQEAKNLYMLAADKGNQHTQLALSELAREGRDYVRAYYWASICARHVPYGSLSRTCLTRARQLARNLDSKKRNAVEREIASFPQTDVSEQSDLLCLTTAKETCD